MPARRRSNASITVKSQPDTPADAVKLALPSRGHKLTFVPLFLGRSLKCQNANYLGWIVYWTAFTDIRSPHDLAAVCDEDVVGGQIGDCQIVELFNVLLAAGGSDAVRGTFGQLC